VEETGGRDDSTLPLRKILEDTLRTHSEGGNVANEVALLSEGKTRADPLKESRHLLALVSKYRVERKFENHQKKNASSKLGGQLAPRKRGREENHARTGYSV